MAVKEQAVQVLNMGVFKSFIHSVSVGNEACFQLENGVCDIKALGVVAHCNYSVEVPIRGMMGLKATLTRLHANGEDIDTTLEFYNPSPLEIEHG